MTHANQHTHKGFNFGLISLFLVVTTAIFMNYFYRLFNSFDTIVFVILSLSFGIVSILGVTYFIKGMKEPTTFKKVLGMFLNSGTLLLFLYGLISYIVDVT